MLLSGALLSVACVGRAPFESKPYAGIEHAITKGGLKICSTTPNPTGQANQALDSRSYEIAFACAEGDAEVVVDRFGSAADRDAAVQNFEVLSRPSGNGVAYTFGPFAIFVFGPSEDAVQDRLNQIFRAMGAQ